MLRYQKIRKMDIANGPGVRVSIFLQGCEFYCDGCFNPETHDFSCGKEFTDDSLKELLHLCEADYVQGLSILGGEPLHPRNIAGTIKIAKSFKERFPSKTSWVWSGYSFENVVDKTIFDFIDVIVDGLFKKELANPMLKYRGSSNQRVIDVKRTQQTGQVVLWQLD
ncbi:MAG: anaerobic ribonucleoside-triphosphate reductase activating protein [Clostridia bacterium]|nr:anaerobic ribonucleoside-triphosphate reductase activating protein [Clostridia bacterium]